MQQKFWGIDASAVDLMGAGKEAITFNLFGTSSPWTWHLDIVILAVFVIAIVVWLVQLLRGREKVLSESSILALLAIFAAIFKHGRLELVGEVWFCVDSISGTATDVFRLFHRHFFIVSICKVEQKSNANRFGFY